MKYWSFASHEYWALIAAESMEEAFHVYALEVAGESIGEVKKEGKPVEVLRNIAFAKYINAVSVIAENHEKELGFFIKDFNAHKNQTILITSELA